MHAIHTLDIYTCIYTHTYADRAARCTLYTLYTYAHAYTHTYAHRVAQCTLYTRTCIHSYIRGQGRTVHAGAPAFDIKWIAQMWIHQVSHG